MKVKIIRTTSTVNHGLLSVGKIFSVSEKGFSEKTFERWIRRGIAEEFTGKEVPEKEFTGYDSAEPEAKEPEAKEDKTEESELEQMTFQELRKVAKESGYENYGKMNTAQLVELLTEEPEPEKDPFFDGFSEGD